MTTRTRTTLCVREFCCNEPTIDVGRITENLGYCAQHLYVRVEIPPHTDAWMRGDRFGHVVARDTERVTVLMDKSGRHLTFTCEDLDTYGRTLANHVV